ncbi:hypothetical protein BDV23DRAFT_186429 [Aspergillus alliaceus]|uniref:Uncharacterized protein n=1 Tax=Petromyces alliaceus TaxID=209559 RepID=A0A5N7BZY3_PETAA|nr:hypothetical protein BDV23DRAFT_186429 [Aspergillus alliaceus]
MDKKSTSGTTSSTQQPTHLDLAEYQAEWARIHENTIRQIEQFKDRPRTAWVQERRGLPPIGRRADNARRKSFDEKNIFTMAFGAGGKGYPSQRGVYGSFGFHCD